ncbi:MAG TPA: sugar ABC transporter permease [Halococcus sp.]|nr:sugar ABC transporter permease [Halococcus sp.]
MRRSIRRLLGRNDTQEDARTDGGTVSRQSRVSVDGETLRGLAFWLPPVILVGLFVYGAIAWNLVISLTDWEGLGNPEYGGLDVGMYAQLLSDPTFWNAAKNTIVLIVVFTVVSLAIGLLVAILVDRNIRFENTFRTIYLLPMSLSFVVTALFWTWMYDYNSGLINELFRFLGLNALAQPWLDEFKLAAVIFALIWQFSGYCMVVYLAGLRAIPTDQYEAAKADGASTLRMYWRVIVPQLRASTMSAAVVLVVFALKAFDFLFVMFGDTPGPSADILALMMFREAFSDSNWAYGSAVAMVLFVMALGVIGPYLYSQYRRGEL